MFFIYGSRKAHLVSAKSKTCTCQSCQRQGTLIFSIFRRHAHLFWLPLFPIGRIGYSVCEHCKNLLEKDEMPPHIRREYDHLNGNTKGPFWQYTGLFLFIISFVLPLILAFIRTLLKSFTE